MNDLVTALYSGKVLLMDGAMGTELQRLTQSASVEDGERLNLTDPDLVRSIHRAYLDAGAEVLLTNTFQANPSRHGEQHHAIWNAALARAREVATKGHYVLADVGPVEQLTLDRAIRIVDESKDADGILLETWSSDAALELFAQAISRSERPTMPLLISWAFHRENALRDLVTFDNRTPEWCSCAAAGYGAAALGANCGKDITMSDLVELVQRFRGVHDDMPVFVRPNAGTPTRSEAGWIYPHSAEALASLLPAVLEAGAVMVGGCCGTTPEYIRAFRTVVDAWNAKHGR